MHLKFHRLEFRVEWIHLELIHEVERSRLGLAIELVSYLLLVQTLLELGLEKVRTHLLIKHLILYTDLDIYTYSISILR